MTIPLQGAENRRTFDYQLQGMRTNSQGPFGSQTWSQTPIFDEAGYNAALAQFRAAGGTPGQPPQTGSPQTEPVWDPNAGEGGRWVETPVAGSGGGGDSRYAIEPSRDAFTSNQWTLNTTLSPEQQALYDANVQSQLGQASLLDSLTGRVADATSQPIDWSSVPALSADILNPQGIQDAAADSIYRLNTRYLEPQMAQQEDRTRSLLADQGFVPGTPAYAAEMDRLLQGRERAFADARDRATAGGIQAGQALFNQNLASQQQRNATRTQGIAELLQSRNMPLNELNAMRTGTQVQMPSGPSSSPTPNLSPVDIQGTFNQDYQNQLAGYNAGVAGDNDLFGSLLQLGGLFTGSGGLAGLLGGMGSGGMNMGGIGGYGMINPGGYGLGGARFGRP